MINDSGKIILDVTLPSHLVDKAEIWAYAAGYDTVDNYLSALLDALADEDKETFRNLIKTPIVMPTFDEVDDNE